MFSNTYNPFSLAKKGLFEDLSFTKADTKNQYETNIGMHTSEKFGQSMRRLEVHEVESALDKHGFEVNVAQVLEPTPENGLGEPTYVAKISHTKSLESVGEDVTNLANDLHQEAIPIFDVQSGIGKLHGQHAHEWSGGEFNPEYFKHFSQDK